MTVQDIFLDLGVSNSKRVCGKSFLLLHCRLPCRLHCRLHCRLQMAHVLYNQNDRIDGFEAETEAQTCQEARWSSEIC